MPLRSLRRMRIMPKRYPSDQRERATRMALDRVEEYGSAWAVAHALGPKLGVGPETLRKWVLQAQTDAGQRGGPSSEELAEIKRLKKISAALVPSSHHNTICALAETDPSYPTERTDSSCVRCCIVSVIHELSHVNPGE